MQIESPAVKAHSRIMHLLTKMFAHPWFSVMFDVAFLHVILLFSL